MVDFMELKKKKIQNLGLRKESEWKRRCPGAHLTSEYWKTDQKERKNNG
jgi:hypothetical protein